MKAGEFDPSLLKADCTIDFSGNLASMGATVDALRIGGTAVWVGGVCPQEPIRWIRKRLCAIFIPSKACTITMRMIFGQQ